MKRIFMFSFLFFSFSLFLFSQLMEEGKPQAIIEKDTYDAGNVVKGKRVEYSFTIKNGGTATLKILQAKPTCGCTVTSYDREIPPGGVGKITASVDTRGFRGTLTKTINVQTNDEAKQNFVLSIKMNVITLVNLEPEFVNINTFAGEEGRANVRISSQKPEIFKIQDLKVDNPELKVFIENEGEAKDKAYNLTLVAPPTLKPQHYNGKITFKTNISEQPEAEINYHIYVKKLIYFNPEVLFMNLSNKIYKIIPLEDIPVYESNLEGANVIGTLKANSEVPVLFVHDNYVIVKYENKDGYVKTDKTKKIYGGTKANLWLNAHKKENFEVKKVECELKELKAEIKKLQENSYQLTFTYEGDLPKNNIGTKIKIYTNDKDEPIIEVPMNINLVFSQNMKDREIKQLPFRKEHIMKEPQKFKEEKE